MPATTTTEKRPTRLVWLGMTGTERDAEIVAKRLMASEKWNVCRTRVLFNSNAVRRKSERLSVRLNGGSSCRSAHAYTQQTYLVAQIIMNCRNGDPTSTIKCVLFV